MSDRTTTDRVAVDQLLYLLDAAFENGDWHSLLGNLGTVEPEEWDWIPSGGRRSIREIVRHVGKCKYMYENHAFGDASLDWDELKPTRWIVEMMILHDVYHAGEINHLRSIQREDDHWA